MVHDNLNHGEAVRLNVHFYSYDYVCGTTTCKCSVQVHTAVLLRHGGRISREGGAMLLGSTGRVAQAPSCLRLPLEAGCSTQPSPQPAHRPEKATPASPLHAPPADSPRRTRRALWVRVSCDYALPVYQGRAWASLGESMARHRQVQPAPQASGRSRSRQSSAKGVGG